MTTSRPLRVFLCHSSADKPAVRELYQKLRAEPWIQPWLDEEELFPGMDWNLEIQKTIRETDAIIVCLSKGSITKEGYVQREIKTALDYSDEKPERTVYVIPIRLEECKPPERLLKWQYADYFEGNRDRAIQRLLVSLKRRAQSLGLQTEVTAVKAEPAPKPVEKKPTIAPQKAKRPAESPVTNQPITHKLTLSNGMEFMRVPAGKFLMGSTNYPVERPQHIVDIPYDYWMARFPVTNIQYSLFKKKEFDKGKELHPVVRVNWNDAMSYCQWLAIQIKAELPSGLILRLPTEAEWEKASRWKPSSNRSGQGVGKALEYPWGNQFSKNKCNTKAGGKGSVTPVGLYSSQGDSPYGCADMSGNVWEWTHSLYKSYPYKNYDGREDEKGSGPRILRGGSFSDVSKQARCAVRLKDYQVNGDYFNFGFRVVVSILLPS